MTGGVLKNAVSFFESPLCLARLDDPAVVAACRRSSDAVCASPNQAHMPLALMFMLEDIALGPCFFEARDFPQPAWLANLPEFVVFYARGMWLTAAASLRLSDGLRVRRATNRSDSLVPPLRRSSCRI